MAENTNTWLYTGIIGFITLVFVTILGHVFATRRKRKESFNNAAQKFLNAFTEFLVMLETNFEYVSGGIEAPLPDHNSAAIEFRQYLCFFRRIGFDRSWKKYNADAQEYDKKVQECFCLKNIPHKTNLKLSKRIKALLKYAKPQ